MLETKITTSRATFARVEAGEPPTVAFHKILTRPDGKQNTLLCQFLFVMSVCWHEPSENCEVATRSKLP